MEFDDGKRKEAKNNEARLRNTLQNGREVEKVLSD